MNLLEIAEAVKDLEVKQATTRSHSILVYGPPKVGKTELLGTLCKHGGVRSIHYFDGENGSDTLVKMVTEKKLTAEQAQKINVYRIPDVPDAPYFVETMLKVLVVNKGPYLLCKPHGRVACPICSQNKELAKAPEHWSTFDLKQLTNKDWVVIDSGTQLGLSALEANTKGMSYDQKPGFDEWGATGRMLNDIFSVVQAAQFANFAVTAHQLYMEEKDIQKKLGDDRLVEADFSKVFPSIGTRNFAVNCAKFFGHVIYMHMKMNKHTAGSSTMYRADVITGSRSGMKIEDAGALDFSLVLDKLGLFAPQTAGPETKKSA